MEISKLVEKFGFATLRVWESVKRQVKAAGAAHNEYVLAHKMLKEKHEVAAEA